MLSVRRQRCNCRLSRPRSLCTSGTSYVITSRLPDYALVGNPSVIPGTVAAKPGDTVVLWGTGFGVTNPPVPAGTAVRGAPAVVTEPTVTVGGVKAQVISTVLLNWKRRVVPGGYSTAGDGTHRRSRCTGIRRRRAIAERCALVCEQTVSSLCEWSGSRGYKPEESPGTPVDDALFFFI